jgi:hypothetical protein
VKKREGATGPNGRGEERLKGLFIVNGHSVWDFKAVLTRHERKTVISSAR